MQEQTMECYLEEDVQDWSCIHSVELLRQISTAQNDDQI